MPPFFLKHTNKMVQRKNLILLCSFFITFSMVAQSSLSIGITTDELKIFQHADIREKRTMVTNGNILLVDNDNGYLEINVDRFYEDALTHANYLFDEWDVHDHGESYPNSEEMQQFDAVVWFTGARFGGSVPPDAQEYLSNYLDSDEGGRLFISSQDVGNEIGYSEFYSNYLHAEYRGSFFVVEGIAEGGFRIEGQSQDDIGGGLSFGLTDMNFHDDDDYRPDWISPLAGASSCFFYSDLDNTLLKGGVKSGVSDSSRIIYLSFGLESIDNFNDRVTVLARSLAWLCENEAPLSAEITSSEISIVGQPLQLSGSAYGGIAPYYSWHWDFGDGYTYQGREVTHIYDEAGDYIITLTVKDSAYPQNTRSVQTPVSAVYDSLLEIAEIKNRFFKTGISALIQNTGNNVATDVEMTLNISGGIRNQINTQVSDWISSLQPSETLQLTSSIVFGFGLISIEVTGQASNAVLVTKKASGFVIGQFIVLDTGNS